MGNRVGSIRLPISMSRARRGATPPPASLGSSLTAHHGCSVGDIAIVLDQQVQESWAGRMEGLNVGYGAHLSCRDAT
jgi:hypothetical protein